MFTCSPLMREFLTQIQYTDFPVHYLGLILNVALCQVIATFVIPTSKLLSSHRSQQYLPLFPLVLHGVEQRLVLCLVG